MTQPHSKDEVLRMASIATSLSKVHASLAGEGGSYMGKPGHRDTAAYLDQCVAMLRAYAEVVEDAARWRAARDNRGDGLRIIIWDHNAVEELQVLFPSVPLCDKYADTALTAALSTRGG